MSESKEIITIFKLYLDDIWLFLKQWDPLFAKYIETKGLMEDICQKLKTIKPATDALMVYKMIQNSSVHTDALVIYHRNEVSVIMCHLIYKCVYPIHESEMHFMERSKWSSQRYWEYKALYDTVRQKVLSSNSYDIDSIKYELIEMKSIKHGNDINEMVWDYLI
jgi:hypothetical protein